ncbi:myosin-G heavy chain-like [Bactrocera neohumeralis]|uniref:myosin-G heavy chain-like n=1 Tax=Bactrocera neohumeralis TaxID=98809 RepID=UPI0021662D7E|nr:myosin-G heavy chain-like [Bactrocera neohumeralis]
MSSRKKADDPKFIVIEATDPSRPVASYSCFAIHHAIKQISSEVHNISTLRDGKLLLLVKNNKIADKFLRAKQLVGVCPILATLHASLNQVKGTVYAPFLNNVAEEEIIQELSPQGVVEVYKFKKYIDGKLLPSGVVLLTFNLYNLPNKIDIAWCKVFVRQYIPLPMRCKSCQILGHTKNKCQRSLLCENCSLPPHSPSDCANCFQAHPFSSKECPKFVQAKEILKIKTTNKCSMREATKIYKQQANVINSSKSSYADIASTANASKTSRNYSTVTTNNTINSTNTTIYENNNNANKNNLNKTQANIDNLDLSHISSTPSKQANIPDSPKVESYTAIKTNKNIPSTININKQNNSSNSPVLEISHPITDQNEIETNYNINPPLQSNSPYSFSQLQSYYQPLPTLSQVLATQEQNTSKNEMLD